MNPMIMMDRPNLFWILILFLISEESFGIWEGNRICVKSQNIEGEFLISYASVQFVYKPLRSEQKSCPKKNLIIMRTEGGVESLLAVYLIYTEEEMV